jgi:hypothetical protein
MADRPFELKHRQIIDGGIRLIFACGACEGSVSLDIRDRDTLQERYPVSCMCGAEVNMFFGSPRVARSMLRALKREAEAAGEVGTAFHLCDSPQLN